MCRTSPTTTIIWNPPNPIAELILVIQINTKIDKWLNFTINVPFGSELEKKSVQERDAGGGEYFRIRWEGVAL